MTLKGKAWFKVGWFDRWNDEDEDRDYKRENPSQVLFDEALRRARASELAPDAYERDPDMVICPGCKCEIDPTMCGCGDSMTNHPNPMVSGHYAVPIGCDCYRSKR